jgi:hypothetical protein
MGSGEEVAEGFDIMAKLKSGDPEGLAEAREYFSSGLRCSTTRWECPSRRPAPAGRKRAIDEAAAQELGARARLRSCGRPGPNAGKPTRGEAKREAVANAQACATAVDEWESAARRRDPDYAKKAALVETTCRAIVQETGKPPATRRSGGAGRTGYERVNKQLQELCPSPSPSRDPVRLIRNVVTEPKRSRKP